MSLAIPRASWGVVITAGTNDVFTFTALGNTYTCTLTAATYATPELLLAHLRTQMLAATRAGPVAFSADGGTIDVTTGITLSATTHRVTIVLGGISSGAAPAILWAANAISIACGTIFGFGTATQDQWGTWGAAASATSTSTVVAQVATFPVSGQSLRGVWTPDVPVADDTLESASYDVAFARSVTAQKAVLQGTSYRRKIKMAFVPAYKVRPGNTSYPAEDVRQLLGSAAGVASLTWAPDRTAPGTNAQTYALEEVPQVASRPDLQLDRYAFDLALVRFS